MRIDARAHEVNLAQTYLQIALGEYQSEKDIDDVEMMRLVTLEYRHILLKMEPAVEHAEHFSDLKDQIEAFKVEKGLTDIEVLQGLTSWLATSLKYMLRYERHGNYDTPAAVTPKKKKK